LKRLLPEEILRAGSVFTARWLLFEFAMQTAWGFPHHFIHRCHDDATTV